MTWWRGAAVAALLVVVAVPAAAADVDDPVALGGAEIDASTDRARPLEVTAGEWADVLGSPADGADRHYFSYRRVQPDSTVHVSVVAAGRPADGFSSEQVDLAASVGEENCGKASGSAWAAATWATFGTRLAVGPGDYDPDTRRQERDSACLNEEVRFEVGRGSAASGDKPDLPVRIKVVEERPLTAADLPEAIDATESWRAPSVTGEPREVTGGAAPGRAAELVEGRSATTVAEGQERFFAVPLGWGEGLRLRVTSPALEELPKGRYSAPKVRVALLDPLGNDVESPLEGTTENGSVSTSSGLELGHGSLPVRYLNREDGNAGYLPGVYLVSLAVAGPPDDAAPLDLPLVLDIEVTGSREDAPPYAEEPAFLVAPDTWRETPSGAVPGDVGGSEGDEDGIGGRRVAALGMAVGGLFALVLGVVLLRLRAV